MICLIKKDRNIRKLFAKKEIKYLVLKSIIGNTLIDNKLRENAVNILDQYLSKINISKIKNYCLITKRSRGVYSKFRLSRIKLREYILRGFIVNYKKSSW